MSTDNSPFIQNWGGSWGLLFLYYFTSIFRYCSTPNSTTQLVHLSSIQEETCLITLQVHTIQLAIQIHTIQLAIQFNFEFLALKNVEFRGKIVQIFLLKLVKKIVVFYTSLTTVSSFANSDKPVTKKMWIYNLF